MKKVFLLLLAVLIVSGCGKNKTEDSKMPVKLKSDLNIEYNSEATIGSLIDDSNGIRVLNKDDIIDTTKIGEQVIVIKYEDDGFKEYEIKINILDTVPPTIEYVSELYTVVGQSIDLLSGVVVKDNSLDIIVPTVEGDYDFNAMGVYNLKYVAIDKSNNKTEVPFTLNVTDKNSFDSSKKIYYRYRTKTTTSYECGYVNCDISETKEPTLTFSSSSPCGGGYNPNINTPCPIGKSCIQVMTKQYKISGNICYDSTYLYENVPMHIKTSCDSDEINVGGYCRKIESKGTLKSDGSYEFSSSSPCGGGYNPKTNTPCPIGKTCIQVMTYQYESLNGVCYDSTYIYVPETTVLKTSCGSGEINVGGTCHTIESKGTYTCESGYSLNSLNKCVKTTAKTCPKTCTKETWSDWSGWSLEKVDASSTVEVQTKEM